MGLYIGGLLEGLWWNWRVVGGFMVVNTKGYKLIDRNTNEIF